MSSRRELSLLVLLLALLFLTLPTDAVRRLRRQKVYPRRNEQKAAYCGLHEHHVRCGPEPQCEKSCENLFSPPYCSQDFSDPKCFYPRCVCDDGFVRDENGVCIRPSSCPFNAQEDENAVEYDVRRRPHHRHHHRNHPSNYFW